MNYFYELPLAAQVLMIIVSQNRASLVDRGDGLLGIQKVRVDVHLVLAVCI